MDAALVCFLVLTAMLLLSALLHAFRQSFKIALLKVTAVGWGYRFRITVWCKIMKKHRTIIHFTADLFLFWLIFEWNGGFIINYVKPFVMNAAQTGWHWLQIAWNYFVYLSPFGRNMAAVPNFKYALIVCNLYVYRLLGFYTDGMLYGGQAQSDKSAHGNSANNPAVVCWFRCLLFNCQNSSVVQGLGGIGGNISKSLHRFFITGGSYEDR